MGKFMMGTCFGAMSCPIFTLKLTIIHTIAAVVAPHQGVPGHLHWQKNLRPGYKSGNNKIIYQHIFSAGATNDYALP